MKALAYLLPILFGGLWYWKVTGIRPFCGCDKCEDKRVSRRYGR